MNGVVDIAPEQAAAALRRGAFTVTDEDSWRGWLHREFLGDCTPDDLQAKAEAVTS